MKRKALRAAFPHTLPVLTGYAFLGLAYGILMQSAGFPFWYPALISLVVYAGSMQYAAVPLLGAAFDPAGAFFLTLMVNARHLFYGDPCWSRTVPRERKRRIWYLQCRTRRSPSMCPPARPKAWTAAGSCSGVSLLDQFYWAAASALGGLLGRVLTVSTKGIEFVMAALLPFLQASGWKTEHRPALVGLGASVLCLALFGAGNFILPAMALIVLLLLVMRPALDKKGAVR
ncbi:MAG: AzlC family ABC transporter permease [Ruthenibacterium lactatiformans]